MADKRTSAGRECRGCKCSLEDPLVIATDVEGDHWCPQCFVHVRAPLEPDRFSRASLRAIACTCGKTSVDFGTGRCVCGRPVFTELPRRQAK